MEEHFIEIHKSSVFTKVLACAVIFLTLFFCREASFINIADKSITGIDGDGGLYYWLASFLSKNIFKFSYFQTSMLYPYGYTLAWSDSFILPSLFVKLLTNFFSFNVSYNACYLLSWFLNGFCTFLLLYALTKSKLFSIFPATLFSINISLERMVGHPQLQFIFFIPLGMYYFFKFLENKNQKYSFLLGVTIFLSFTTAVYYSVFLCLVVFFLGTGILILKPRYIDAMFIKNFLIGLLVGVLPIIFIISPYLDVRNVFGKRGLHETFYFSSNLLSFLPRWKFLNNFNLHFPNYETFAFVGVIPLLSILLTIFIIQKGSKTFRKYMIAFITLFFITGLFSIYLKVGDVYKFYFTAFFLWSTYLLLIFIMTRLRYFEYKANLDILSNRSLVLLMFFVFISIVLLSFGPLGYADDFGKIVVNPLGLFQVFYNFFPGLNSIRAIGRLGQVSILIMYILFSLNFFLLSKKYKKAKYLFLIFVSINFFEQNVDNNHVFDISYLKNKNIIEEKIKTFPKESVILYLPMQKYTKNFFKNHYSIAFYNVKYMIKALSNEHFIINGYSGQMGKNLTIYPQKMSNFPDTRSINTLQYNYNLKYIVYDSSLIEDFNSQDFEKKLSSFSKDLKVLKKDGSQYLIEYIGSFENRETYFLRVPKYKNDITIKIKTENSPIDEDFRKIEVRNMNNDSYVDTIAVGKDGGWKSYKINLDNTVIENKITPYRLKFIAFSKKQKIYLKNCD